MVLRKIDDQFGVSQKVIRTPWKRRQQCVGLWVLAANYAVPALTDGVIEEHELDELDARDVDVAELVRVGLWHHYGDRCDSARDQSKPAPNRGVSIHDFLAHNPSREKVMADREAERVRKAYQRQSKRSPSGTPAGRDSVSEHPVPSRPDPALRTDFEFEASVRKRATAAGVRDLPRLHGLLAQTVKPVDPLSPAASAVLVEAITIRATGDVKDVDAYVVAASRN